MRCAAAATTAGGVDLLAGRGSADRDRFDETATSATVRRPGALRRWVDNIRVGNAFYGGQVGVRGEAESADSSCNCAARSPWATTWSGCGRLEAVSHRRRRRPSPPR